MSDQVETSKTVMVALCNTFYKTYELFFIYVVVVFKEIFVLALDYNIYL